MRPNVPGGFTAIELVVTLVVAGILLALAAPSFRALIERNRVVTEANRVVTSLQAARTESVRRGNAVAVCPSNNGKACNGNWKQGWIVFSDRDDDGTPDLGSGNCGSGEDCILRVAGPPEAGIDLAGPGNVRYRPSGRVQAAGNFTVKNNGCQGQNARRIDVPATGRPGMQESSC